MLKKRIDIDEVVIYNFNIQNQGIQLLYRGNEIPSHLKEYKRLWRVLDKHNKVETIIISV